MGKSAPSPPPAPDPVAIANAQGVANKDTARIQAALNRVNQFGPDGSITYNSNWQQSDDWMNQKLADDRYAHQGMDWNEADARKFFDERNPYKDSYSVTTTLSPESQRIYDMTRQAQGKYGEIGNAQLGAVQQSLSTPYQNPYSDVTRDAIGRAAAASAQPNNTDYSAIRQEAIDAAMSRLNPSFARDEETMRARLLASGIGQGSKGWSAEYSDFNQGRNDARMQAIMNAEGLTGQAIQQTGMLRQMPIQEAGQVVNLANAGMTQGIAERTQPLNEAASLLSGQQVQMPGLMQVPQTQMAPTDVIGAHGLSQQAQNAAYQGQMSAHNASLGGMYGLGSAAIMGAGMFF